MGITTMGITTMSIAWEQTILNDGLYVLGMVWVCVVSFGMGMLAGMLMML